jgi:hypothetical protein
LSILFFTEDGPVRAGIVYANVRIGRGQTDGHIQERERRRGKVQAGVQPGERHTDTEQKDERTEERYTDIKGRDRRTDEHEEVNRRFS